MAVAEDAAATDAAEAMATGTAGATKTKKDNKERTGDEERKIPHRRFFALSGHLRKQKGATDSLKCRYEKRGMQMESERLDSKNRLGYNPNVNLL